MKKVTNYLKQVFDKVIVQAVFTGIIALATAIYTFFVHRERQFTILEIWLLIILGVVLIIMVASLIYRRKNRKIPKYKPVECEYYMIREERVHRWLNETDFEHKRRYKLLSLKDGLTQYVDKFMWTGTSYELSGGDGDYTVVEEGSKNIYTEYRFKFNKPLYKGETIDLEAIWKAKGPAKPFFSTTILVPTDTLIMRVILFPESGIKKVNCEEADNKEAKPNKVEEKLLDSDGEYVWTEPNPKILHHYEINWKSTNNQK